MPSLRTSCWRPKPAVTAFFPGRAQAEAKVSSRAGHVSADVQALIFRLMLVEMPKRFVAWNCGKCGQSHAAEYWSYGERYGRTTRGSTLVCKVCRSLGYRPQALMDYTCQTCMRVFGSLGFPWPVMRRYLKDGRSETAPVSHLLRFDVNRLRRVLDSVRGRTHVSVRASQPQKTWRPTHMQVLSRPRLLREGLEGLHVDDLHRSARSQVLRSAQRPQA